MSRGVIHNNYSTEVVRLYKLTGPSVSGGFYHPNKCYVINLAARQSFGETGKCMGFFPSTLALVIQQLTHPHPNKHVLIFLHVFSLLQGGQHAIILPAESKPACSKS